MDFQHKRRSSAPSSFASVALQSCVGFFIIHPSDTLPNKSPKKRLNLRTLLAVAAVIGFAVSIYYNQALARLRQERSDLQTQVGSLEVTDESKVVISRVPSSDDVIPPGVDRAHVWRYRMHLPANYDDCQARRSGLVSADSPQGEGGGGGGGSSGGVSRPEPRRLFITFALIENDGKWLFTNSIAGMSSASNLSQDFKIDSLDDIVIETAVPAGDETCVYDADDAICLLRLREKELAVNSNGKTKKDRYRGFSLYMYSKDRKDAFEAWASGNADSMEDAE